MYYYIIDPSKLSQKSFDRVQNELYSCLAEYRISGETSRVTSLRTIPQLTELAFSHGVKTLVAVGNDETLQEVISAVNGREVTIGYIPLFQTELAAILGLKSIDGACKTIAARRVEMLDTGVAGGVPFLSRLTFGLSSDADFGFLGMGLLGKLGDPPAFEVKFSADGKYHGSLQVIAGAILNTRDARDGACRGEGIANPTDGMFDVLLLPTLTRYQIFQNRRHIQEGCFERVPGSSLLHLKRLEILSPEGLPLKSGNKAVTKTPAIVEVKPKTLKIIVGRDRTF
ncbi:MAG: diacylglycerol/lipid kinase family protein [Candidatus Saccharibacteria bacterium]